MKKKTDGLSVFLVDMRECRGKGLEIRPLEAMINHNTTEVFFDSAARSRREPDRRGGQGLSLHPRRHERRADPGRRRSASATGAGSSAPAAHYANERVVFDRPIGQNQGIQFPIARAYAETEAADLMVRKAAAMFPAGLPCGAEANMAKLLASEAAWHAAEACMQTHGGFGFAREYDVERKWRETRLYADRADLDQPGSRLHRRARPGHAAVVLTAATLRPLRRGDSMTGLTESLGNFVAQPGFREIPPEAARIVQSGFIDSIATMLAARNEPVVEILRRFVADRRSQAAEARVLLGVESAGSADAALINGTATHALDYDDVALGGHPSTVLVPAVLAEGERLDVSGETAMRAYLVGYEVWAELCAREPDSYHLKGWHPTSVLGTVGAAAAVASLHRLSPQSCRHALALAASMASGLAANFGTMTKPLHAGRAAACAIDAVRLAAHGLTAAPDAIEHHAGYLAALSPKGAALREGTAERSAGSYGSSTAACRSRNTRCAMPHTVSSTPCWTLSRHTTSSWRT